MKLYRTNSGIVMHADQLMYLLEEDWDQLINRENLFEYLTALAKTRNTTREDAFDWSDKKILAPIGKQELWAAGVTYLRSRDARMEEAQTGGNADCYEKVYGAERPELFFKALPQRVAAHQEQVYIRKDSHWNVPEPELTLYINSKGNIQGYTIGNDMSSRDIEGENPLYLPQAKVYERSAALGPCLYIPSEPISKETGIQISIERDNKKIFGDRITIAKMKRGLEELAHFLFRECDFEFGCFLMTGTGMVPPPDFTLQVGDRVTITIDQIGTLVNIVGKHP